MRKFKLFLFFFMCYVPLSLYAAPTVYEDAEDGNTAGWSINDPTPAGASFTNVFDTEANSNVIETTSRGTSNGFILGGFNDTSGWNNTTQKIISWKMKFSGNYIIYIRVHTQKWHGYLYYNRLNNDRGLSSNGKYVHHGLGSESSDGNWQTFTRDLEADLKEFEPDNTIISVNGFLVRGSGRIDDVQLLSPVAGAYTCANPKLFDIAYQTNAPGNIKLIGNTNICKKNSAGQCIEPGFYPPGHKYAGKDLTNNSIVAQYKDGDTVVSTINSSAAKLELPENAEILWAGLYWQGYFQKSNFPGELTDAIRDKSKTMKLGYSNDGVSPNTNPNYIDITADEFNWVYFNDSRWYYQSFAEVTEFVKQNEKGWYWGSDLNLHVGTGVGGGSLGAWSIAIAYKDNADSVKNLTVYHGYLALAGTTDVKNAYAYAEANDCDPLFTGVQKNTQISLNGFRTPSSGDIESRFIFFGGEGDISLTGDGMSMTDKSDVSHTFSNNANPATNSINSSISDFGIHRGGDLLYPRYGYNTIGIDIDTFDTSGDGSNGNFLNHKQTETDIKLYTSGDGYSPGGFGLATQLYTPEICYDYSVSIGDSIKVPSTNRDVNTSKWGNLPLVTKIFIRSMEADFDLTNTRLKVNFTPSGKFAYKNDATFTPSVSPPNINTYFDAIETNTSQISIGKNNSVTGGTIGKNETIYAKLGFDFLSADYINSHFEIEIETEVIFDTVTGIPTPYLMSTAADRNSSAHMQRCPRNPVYDPLIGSFNIERDDSTFTQTKAERYPLFTQLSGRDFNVSIASYGGPNFDQAHEIDYATIELEIIDAGGFDNNSSNNYDSVCEEPASIGGEGALLTFANTDRIQVDLKNDLPHFNNDRALQSAAFRLWILTKEDINSSSDILVKHLCTDKTDEQCFKDIYDTHYKDAQDATTGACASACGPTPNECYDCLKKYFATPICSRDNFSIRPEAYRINIGDNNETNTTAIMLTQNSSSEIDPNISLSSGYKYTLDINATQFKSAQVARGYYNNKFVAESNLSALDPTSRILAPLEFDDSTVCIDTTHKTLAPVIQNGQSISHTTLSHDNVGQYKLWMSDSNWTNVDQASYPFKTVFDEGCKNNVSDPRCSDCRIDNAQSTEINGKVGCVLHSSIPNNDRFVDIPLNFNPYGFNISDQRLVSQANPNNTDYIYVSDLNNSLNMSAKIEATLSAISKNGQITTNFIDGCAAQDIILDLNRSMVPKESNLSSYYSGHIPFQQKLVSTLDSSVSDAIDNNITFTKSNFISSTTNNGTAFVDLRFNFPRPTYPDYMNPINVNFSALQAQSPDSMSKTHLSSNYIPDDYNTGIIGESRFFYFAKVAPIFPFNDTIKVSYSDTITSMLRVSVYCTDPVDINVTCTDMGINGAFLDESNVLENWYRMTEHSSLEGEGKVNSLSINPSSIHLAPSSNINLDTNGSSVEIVATYPLSSPRRKDAKITIDADPWLLYDPTFDISFRTQGFRWKGEGKTGHVVEVNSSAEHNFKRLNW